MTKLPGIFDEGRGKGVTLVTLCCIGQGAGLMLSAFATRDIFIALHSGNSLGAEALLSLGVAAALLASCEVYGSVRAEELLARIDVLHRRQSQYADSAPAKEVAEKTDGVNFDTQALRLTVDGSEIELSVKERKLIVLFLSNRGKVLSRERILNSVWGTQQDPPTNVVDVYIGRLRRKLGVHGKHLVTVRGAGYRFEDE